MKIYTKRSHGDRAGERIEAEVEAVYDGYTVGYFRHLDAPHDGGWRLMPRAYQTLARLLAAVERAGYHVDGKSAGIK